MKQEKPEMDDLKKKSLVLTEIYLEKFQYIKKIYFFITLQKCHKIFLHIFLLKNILCILFLLYYKRRKKIAFFCGAGVDLPPLSGCVR